MFLKKSFRFEGLDSQPHFERSHHGQEVAQEAPVAVVKVADKSVAVATDEQVAELGEQSDVEVAQDAVLVVVVPVLQSVDLDWVLPVDEEQVFLVQDEPGLGAEAQV